MVLYHNKDDPRYVDFLSAMAYGKCPICGETSAAAGYAQGELEHDWMGDESPKVIFWEKHFENHVVGLDYQQDKSGSSGNYPYGESKANELARNTHNDPGNQWWDKEKGGHFDEEPYEYCSYADNLVAEFCSDSLEEAKRYADAHMEFVVETGGMGKGKVVYNPYDTKIPQEFDSDIGRGGGGRTREWGESKTNEEFDSYNYGNPTDDLEKPTSADKRIADTQEAVGRALKKVQCPGCGATELSYDQHSNDHYGGFTCGNCGSYNALEAIAMFNNLDDYDLYEKATESGQGEATEELDSVIGDEQKDEIFQYLFELQSSGVTNMFGAVPYAQEEFPHLDKKEVKAIVMEWMKNYSEIHDRMGIDFV